MNAYTIDFKPLERVDFADACDNAMILLSRAESVFHFLHSNISAGLIDRDDPGIAAICEMSALALEHEGGALRESIGQLEMMLRSADPVKEGNHADQ